MPPSSARRVWIAPLLFAALVAVFGAWSDARLRQTLQAQLRADLTTTIDANVTALDIWMTNQMTLASVLASEPQFRELALSTLTSTNTNTNTPGNPGRRPRTSPEQDELSATLRSRIALTGYPVAQLVSTNLTILGSTMRGRFGGPQSVLDDHVARYSELFASAQPVIITPFKPPRPQGRGPGPGRSEPPARSDRQEPPDRRERLDRNRDGGWNDRADRPPSADPNRFRRGDLTLMQVAAPILDDQGNVRGALALIVDPDKEFTRILSVARSGRSRETYAFDQRGLLISRSRFDDQLRTLGLIPNQPDSSSALALRLSDPGSDNPASIAPEDPAAPTRPLTLFASNAIAGNQGVAVAPTRDYRGIPVVGAWRWLPHRGFGVVTQVDASEAFESLRILRLLFLILVLLLLLAAFSLLLVSFANVAWRRRVNEAELRLKQLGQYTLEDRIGEGGMGVVYRARHAILRRETAVKLLLPDRANPEAIRRFEREVCLTCRLTHPNTIQVYDYGRTPDGIFYYAMEFLSGLNLHDLVRLHGPLPESRVIHVLTQTCDALAEAHSLGLVHRDIKPANIFLCHRGGVPDCVKVLDFGLVREIHRPEHPASPAASDASTSSTITGTPSFMPPESLKDPLGADCRSDLYSVGALGYFLLTGHRVFDADNLFELCEHHLRSEPIPPGLRSTNPVSPELDRIILECLAKSPDQRPASASNLRQRLETTPHAHDWTLAARTDWWTRHGSTASPTSTSTSTSSTKPSPLDPDASPSSNDLPTVACSLPIDLDHRTPAG